MPLADPVDNLSPPATLGHTNPAPSAAGPLKHGDIFVVFNGRRIAKRGHPGTKHDSTWVSLEPGIAVYSNQDLGELVIEENGVAVGGGTKRH